MEVLKSSRFWISLVICICLTVLAALGAISGELAIGNMTGMLGGFSIGKIRAVGEPRSGGNDAANPD